MKNPIGHPVNSAVSRAYDWYSQWPQIDSRGVIIAIHDGDCIPPGLKMVDYHTQGKRVVIEEVDGANGFMALIEPGE